MNNKFIEKPYQFFLTKTKKPSFYLEDSYKLNSNKLPFLLHKLSKFCYLITDNDQKIFDIEKEFYDTAENNYERLIRLNRPKQIQVFIQKTYLKQKIEKTLTIRYKNHHKHQYLKIPISTYKKVEDWHINSLLQQKNLNFPLLRQTHEQSLSRIILLQPHSNTIIHIDFDITLNQTEKPYTKITIQSESRNNQLSKLIQKIHQI